MRTGSLNVRVALQSATEARDAFGGVTLSWATFATRWASIETTGGGETDVADSAHSGADHTVRIRYDSAVAATVPRNRVVYGSRTFEIVAVDHVDQRRREIVLRVKEQR